MLTRTIERIKNTGIALRHRHPIVTSAATAGLGLSLGFIINLLFARIMSANDYGIWCYVINLSTTASYIATLGLDRVAVIEIPHLLESKHPGDSIILSRKLLKWSAVSGIGAAALLLAFPPPLQISSAIWYLAGCSTAVSTMLLVSTAVNMGNHQVHRAQTLNVIIRPLCTLLLATAFFIYSDSALSALCAMLCTVIGCGVVLCISTRTIPKAQRIQNNSVKVPVGRSIALWAASSIGAVSSRQDIIILGNYFPASEIGAYNVSTRIASLCATASGVQNMLTGPSAAQFIAQGQLEELQLSVSRGTRTWFLWSCLPVLIIIIFASPLLKTFNTGFDSASASLKILALTQLANIATGPSGTLLSAFRLDKEIIKASTLGLTVGIALSLLLIPSNGLIGAAASSSLAVLSTQIYAVISIYTKTGINPTIFTTRFFS